MAGITLEKGKAIYTYGQPMTALHLITTGRVRADYPGGSYTLGKGDVIGICEICSEIHFISYTVTETATILSYPLSSINILNDLLQKHADMARFFLLSACRQINTLQNSLSTAEITSNSLYQHLFADYDNYSRLCERYRIRPRELDGLNNLSVYIADETEEPWLTGYYQGLTNIYAGEHFRDFLKEASVSMGILKRGSLDFQRVWNALDEQSAYQKRLAGYYFNESGNDLFDFYTSLYYKLEAGSEDSAEVLNTIRRIAEQSENKLALSQELAENRTKQFFNTLSLTTSEAAVSTESADASALPAELAGSLNIILDFAGKELGIADSFRQHVHSYKLLSDKSSMDSNVCALRRALTEEFYVLYTALFEQTLLEENVPIPVWMFLYFGYVDEDLAGIKNATTLYRMVPNMTDNSAFGVYTFYHWLLAIFRGEKEPSRNEFDQDYTDFLHKQKMSGTVTEQDLMALERNSMGKVNYELQNMFPTVNKITYGRISTFCPIFTAESAQKDLESAYVTVSKIAKAAELVRKVDYSAFYREGLDMDHIDVMGKIPIHTECIPDVILLPNAGIRTVMWQEIEGKKRNTPGRMCFSLFHMEDLTTSYLRMTAEFRWELCKRIQGARWNDVSEASLTSEYFDYIQFYRKNHDLSNEAKERIRTGLLQTKNSFREMFVRDYIQWVIYEGSGSPRLNKVARKIFFTYCPFTTDICEKLDSNPMYSELLARHRLQRAQKKHQLEMLRKKLWNSGTTVPETLEQELEYYEK